MQHLTFVLEHFFRNFYCIIS